MRWLDEQVIFFDKEKTADEKAVVKAEEEKEGWVYFGEEVSLSTNSLRLRYT